MGDAFSNLISLLKEPSSAQGAVAQNIAVKDWFANVNSQSEIDQFIAAVLQSGVVGAAGAATTLLELGESGHRILLRLMKESDLNLRKLFLYDLRFTD